MSQVDSRLVSLCEVFQTALKSFEMKLDVMQRGQAVLQHEVEELKHIVKSQPEKLDPEDGAVLRALRKEVNTILDQESKVLPFLCDEIRQCKLALDREEFKR